MVAQRYSNTREAQLSNSRIVVLGDTNNRTVNLASILAICGPHGLTKAQHFDELYNYFGLN